MPTHSSSPDNEPPAAPAQVVAAHGDIDIETLGPLRQALEAAADSPVVVLDASGITFADSSFLSVLLTVRQRTDLRVAGAPPQVKRLLELTGADRIIALYPSVAQAQRADPVG